MVFIIYTVHYIYYKLYIPYTLYSIAGYVLGEFGVNICEQPDAGGYEQFIALQQHFVRVGPKTKSLLLTAYVKILNLYPTLKDIITDVFTKYSTSQHLELQQRSCEYRLMPNIDATIMESVLDSMPVFNEKV